MKMKEKENRKGIPIYSGVISYFPLALKAIAKVSYVGQQQHNPDKALAWDRSKSGDELDAMMRHLVDHASGIEFDDDGVRHIEKCGWRMLGYIQKHLEEGKGCSVGEKFVIDQSFYHTAMNREQLYEFAENINERED